MRPQLAALIMGTLAREPADRPTALELFEAFDDLASEHGLPRLRLR